MLLTVNGYRKYTPEECALLEFGAMKVVELLRDYDNIYETGVPQFDRLEFDEKLVALRCLCIRAASDDLPEERELWVDATLMAVLSVLRGEVECLFSYAEDAEETGMDPDYRSQTRAELANFSHLIASAYLSCHWDLKTTLSSSERTVLDQIFLRVHRYKGEDPRYTADELVLILKDLEHNLFYDWDFMISDEALDFPPEVYEILMHVAGMEPTYQINTVPSCRPAAIAQARQFFESA